MQKNQQWPFPANKILPFSLVYYPKMNDQTSQLMNPFLGYPNSPLIGRYNQGQYRIAQIQCQLKFVLQFDPFNQQYKCGMTTFSLPTEITHNLRSIPQIIPHNKPPQSKNPKIQQTHPIFYPIINNLSFYFMITFGQIGKDFLNYLNHMYTLAQDLFIDQKLRRSVYLLPIYAYLPEKSGIIKEQVDKGLNFNNYRSQYMSLHLKYGAPAFSPNNMRLGIQGMKKVQTNPLPKNNKKNYVEKKDNLNLNQSSKLQQQKKQQKKQQFKEQIQQQKKSNPNTKTQIKTGPHKGFIHFYTSMLLQNDYRVYYHWQIENKNRQQLIYTALMSSKSLIQFIEACSNLLGFQDQCVNELRNIFKE